MSGRVLHAMIFMAILVSGALGPTSVRADIVRIDQPEVDGELLDWCKFGARGCGQPAADAFCRASGYKRSVRFLQWINPNKPTRFIANGYSCNDPECDSFRWIECKK